MQSSINRHEYEIYMKIWKKADLKWSMHLSGVQFERELLDVRERRRTRALHERAHEALQNVPLAVLDVQLQHADQSLHCAHADISHRSIREQKSNAGVSAYVAVPECVEAALESPHGPVVAERVVRAGRVGAREADCEELEALLLRHTRVLLAAEKRSSLRLGRLLV